MKKRILFWVSFVLFLLVTSLSYRKFFGSFSFVDEYNNFIVPWFMLQGRKLYTEIFFNHQPLPIYISFALQWMVRPKTLYQLVALHRAFMLVWSFGWAVYLAHRFRLSAVLCVLVIELTKFYLFGNMFQAEGLIIYPLLALFGFAWEGLQKKKIQTWEYIEATVICWFVVFSREIFIPLAIYLLFIILVQKLVPSTWKKSIAVLIGLSLITLATLPLRSYVFSLIEVNRSDTVANELAAQGSIFSSLLRSVAYPVLVFTEGTSTHLRVLEQVLVLGMVCLFLVLLVRRDTHGKSFILFIVGTLALSALRLVPPGTVYYQAYRMLPWFVMLTASVSWTFAYVLSLKKHHGVLLLSLPFAVVITFLLLRPQSFLWEKIDQPTTFTNNYARYASVGETVRLLSLPTDTFFVNDYSSLTYWPAKLKTPYTYALNYPVTVRIPMYEQEKITMFREHPPDFYDAGDCEPVKNNGIPPDVVFSYAPLFKGSEVSCLFVRKEKMKNISQAQWDAARVYGYHY